MLVLEKSEGRILLVTDKEWNIEHLEIEFTASLRSGSAVEEDIDYIVERMQQCPVSRNLQEIEHAHTRISFTTL